jgi:hypothetical protein
MVATRDIAVYGAVVSTFALLWTVGWALYKDAFRDRARVRVTAAEGRGMSAGAAPQPAFYVTVANRGRRAVTIQSVFQVESGISGMHNFMLSTLSGLPKRLNESESHIIMLSFGSYTMGSMSKERWYVLDGAGRRHPLRERYRQRVEAIMFAAPRRVIRWRTRQSKKP